MKRSIMDYIPKKKRDWVDYFWKDSDGYWLILKPQYRFMGAHTIHNWTIKGVLEDLRLYKEEKGE